MRKNLHYLLMILMSWMLGTAFAQGDNGFHVRFSVADATCYNNGKVLYALTNSSGAVLDTLPPLLSQVRVYYRLNETDSAHYAGWYYTGGTDTMTLNYGTYIVGVEGLLADSTGGFTRVDTQTVLTIATVYQKPTAAVVPFEARFKRNDAGTLFTIPCEDIGRVQLRILYGQFPYMVTVMDNTTGDTLRTVSFGGRQYSGTSETSYNYKDYYSIDSLPGGDWAFHVEDGCGYGLPNVVAAVEIKKLHSPSSIGIIASSGNFSDTNVVKISLDYISPVNELMEFLSRYARYRFRFGDGPADEWRPVPGDAEVTGRYVHFTDTVGTATRYCDLWERNFTFEYEMSGCGTASLTKTFQIQKPNALYFEKDSVDVDDSIRMTNGGCAREEYWHRQSYSIRYYKQGASPQYSPDNRSATNADDDYYRYHYTHPIAWVYTDTRTGAVIKRDTVPIITEQSYLTDDEVISVYGEWSDSVFVIPVERKLLDGRGCELYTTFDSLRYIHCVSTIAANWRVSRRDDGDKCCTSPRLVRVFRSTEFGGPADGTVIRLVRSPYNNLYNFEAVYHAVDKSWTVVKDSVGNTAAITGAALGDELIISDYCLPSGPYDFEVITTCGVQLLQSRASFKDYMVMRQTEEIECVTSRDCGNLYIRYPHGAYQWVKTNTSSLTGLPLDTIYENIPMKATVMEAPSASLKGLESYDAPQFIFSMPGTYVLRVCPNLAVDECSSYICRYDTFFLDAATVEFEEALAVLCDASSTEGDAWVRAGNGIPPYTFTLYDQPDKQGNILAVNNTGVFPNVPMHSDQTLSCLVQDSCNAYFHVNFKPVAMAGLQKLWFDGGVTETTACEGSTLQIHALAVGDIWQYEWSGPNGFTATTSDPYAFVPRGSGGGWYKVVIRQASCTDEISDSIQLTVLPSPTLVLAPDSTVCPGEVVQVRFTPHSDASSGKIPFSIAFENASGVRIRQYSSTTGVTVTDTFSTRSPAKIYPVSVQDSQCEYLLADPEDTIHVSMRTDAANACRVITTFDTVCYGGDAHLSAVATDTVPYILRWFGDYDQTHLLKTDTLLEEGSWSHYDTAGILRRTLLYVSLQKEGECPSINGLTDSAMAMRDGETVLACGRHIRFYDSGGPTGSSGTGERLVHRFRTSDGTRVSIHFDDLALSGAARLLVFTGGEGNADSLLLDLAEGSAPMQTAVSSGNELTVYYLGNGMLNSDWSAVVEASPGIAVADVRHSNIVLYMDEVCQSQTNIYDDPYGMAPEVVSADELAQAIRKAGNYYYTSTFPATDSHGCDSTVHFRLTVNPPVVEETVATVPRKTGLFWHDSLYVESGRYASLSTDPGGCDHLDVLYLTVFEAEAPDAEICRGDSVTLTLSASFSEMSQRDTLTARRARSGDVLCDDGSILPVDSFFASGKVPKGVVFHVDETGIHGLAVALTETSKVFSTASPYLILSTSYFTLASAVRDSDGEANTLHLKSTDDAYSGLDFASDVTAGSYCYYFNHRLLAPDGLHHGWFLPSAAELNLLQGSAWEVKQSINRICQTDNTYKNFSSSRYWSSTFRSGSQVWTFSNTEWSGQAFSNLCGVRPVTKF